MVTDSRYSSMSPSDMAGSHGDQEYDVEEAKKLNDSIPIWEEFGATGLKRSVGFVDEEFLPQLRGRKAVKIYKEMSENEPLIGALLFTITNLIRNVKWEVNPGGKSREDTMIADLLETSMDDMNQPWDTVISEIMSMLVYGWSYHEIVYKMRGGLYNDKSKMRSKHTDRMISWRKLPIRAQETLHRWVFDETGDVKAMVQIPPPRYQQLTIPIERSLLFRPTTHKGNPEGISMLRTAYRPWFMKKRIEEYEAIGVERDLAGLPIVKVPAEWMNAKKGSAQYKNLQQFKKMVRSVKRDEQEGLVFPSAYDQDSGKPLYEFQLLGSGGGRTFPTDNIIRRYEERMLMTVLADFIMVGHQANGSYSLHTDKTGIFRAALNTVVASIADVFNRHAIPRLVQLNGFKPEKMPKLVPGDVSAPDLGQLSSFMSAMSGMGLQWFPDPEMEKFVRDVARMPKASEEDLEREKKMAEKSEASRYMDTMGDFFDSKADLEEQMRSYAASGMTPNTTTMQQGQGQQEQPESEAQ